MIVPVILCGGAGSRLWPASRTNYPKQLVPFNGARSMFQETLSRLAGGRFGRAVVVAGHDYRFLIAEQAANMGIDADLLIEPCRRDSCAALAAAAFHVNDPDAVLLVLAADHVVTEADRFRASVEQGLGAADAGHIVTFGVTPTYPATGYGYIKPGPTLNEAPGASRVARFCEKPDAATAQCYLDDGYLWNSGNLLVRPAVFLGELQRFEPGIHDAVGRSVDSAGRDLDFIRLDSTAFATAPAKSVDYAVLERTDRGAVVPTDLVWSDIGNWASVWEQAEKDADGNAAKGNVVLRDASGSYVSSPDILTAVVGVSDLIVVTTRDAVLVVPRQEAEKVKALVEGLAGRGLPETQDHLLTYRPWGSYRQLDAGERYQVKHIKVKPQARLSLQSHRYRAEHWVVVAGTARVTVDGATTEVGESQSIFVPAGAVHRLENPGPTPLEVIEIQTGAYLGEDDIVRIEDDYSRQ